MTNDTQNATRVTKETKNKIRVEFERTSLWERMKIKYLSLRFLGRVVFVIFRVVLLLGISYIILYPFITKIAGSFMSPEDFADVTVKLISRNPTLDTYKAIIEYNHYFDAALTTLGVSLVSALAQMIACCVIAYGFAKYKFKGSKFLFFCVVFTMVVPHQTIKSALSLKFRYFDIGVYNFGIIKLFTGGQSLNLLDTYWPMVILSLTGLAFKNGLYIFMLRQFFKGIPDSLEESAYIDGSGVFRTFVQIILPLSVPMLITVFLFAFSWQWTDNFYVSIFFPGREQYVFTKILTVPAPFREAVNQAGGSLFNQAIMNTCAIMLILPLVVVYRFCQRFLIQGIERSGITGE